MDAKDILRLQEAYLEVHQEQELDEAEGSYGSTPKAHLAFSALARKRNKDKRTKGGDIAASHARRTDSRPNSSDQDRIRRSMTQSDRDKARGASKYGHVNYDPDFDGPPSGPGGNPKGKKLARQKATGVSAESYDLYDIILSHLLDEGYAETQQAAQVIMVNMSEDWRDSIVEAIEGLRPASERMKGALTSSQRASQQARARREQKKQEELEKAANAVLNQMSGVSRRSSTPMGSTPAPQKSEAPQANRTIKPKVKRDDLASAADEVLRSLR